MGARGRFKAMRALVFRGRSCPYPYGLLAPVARVATPGAAEEVRLFLDAYGIRSTIAPSSRRGRRGKARAGLNLQVLVFIEDLALARRLVNEWTVPVHQR